MCIYCGTDRYRKIYENHFGPIPKENNGRSYHIHHKDGNRSNNNPDNLKAVSIQEHYDIHYLQGDWAACLALTRLLNKSPEEISALARLNANNRIKNGIHPFIKRPDGTSLASDMVKNGTHPFLNGEKSRQTQLNLVKNGTHHLLSGDIQRKSNEKRILDGTHNFLGPKTNALRIENGTHHFLRRQDGSSLTGDKVKNGTHPFLGPKLNLKRISEGTHNFVGQNAPSQVVWTCEHCGKTGKGKGNYTRAHGNNCNQLKTIDLQLKKAALDQKINSKVKEVENIPEGQGQMIDRNEILKMLSENAKNNK